MASSKQSLHLYQPEVNPEYNLQRSDALKAASDLLARIPEGSYDSANKGWQGVTMTPVLHSGDYSEQLNDKRVNVTFMFSDGGEGLSFYQISCRGFGIGQLAGEEPSVFYGESSGWTKRIDTEAWSQTTEQIRGLLNGDLMIISLSF